MRCLILRISFRFTKDSVLSAIFIVILLVVLVVGIQYTVYNCQKLARTVRNDDKTRNKSTTLHIHQNAVKSLKQQALTYSRTTHQQLGNELESMQQLEQSVSMQVKELQSVLSHYVAMQQKQQRDDNDNKQD